MLCGARQISVKTAERLVVDPARVRRFGDGARTTGRMRRCGEALKGANSAFYHLLFLSPSLPHRLPTFAYPLLLHALYARLPSSPRSACSLV
jgi:hypothetical protein